MDHGSESEASSLDGRTVVSPANQLEILKSVEVVPFLVGRRRHKVRHRAFRSRTMRATSTI
jgi:hypothetical protein